MKSSRLHSKCVLVTGASTGIGRAISEYLAQRGLKIYACARKRKDIDSLDSVENIVGLKLDVTKSEDLRSIVEYLTSNDIKLYAVINNAGIVTGGPLVLLDEQEIRACFDVNCMGVVNVSRELFPFLEEKGRFINISSIGAKYVTPFLAPYHMANVAMEAFSESLRIELSPFSHPVVLIRPGAIKTEADNKNERFIKNIRGTVYDEAFEEYWERILQQHKKALPPERVAEIVFKALKAKKPKKTYLIPHRRFLIRFWLLLGNIGFTEKYYSNFLRKRISSDQKTKLYWGISLNMSVQLALGRKKPEV